MYARLMPAVMQSSTTMLQPYSRTTLRNQCIDDGLILDVGCNNSCFSWLSETHAD